MKQNQRQQKQQSQQPQPKKQLQPQQFLQKGKNKSRFNIEKWLVPLSILLSGILITSSILVSGKVLFGKSDLITKATLNAAVKEALSNAGTAPAANPTAQAEEFVAASTELDDDPIKGDKSKAKVAIVEFSDYECPFCKRHFTQTHSQLIDTYVKTGKAILVFRDYPLAIHDPLATTEAMAAECVDELAGDEKYFEYHDLIFTNTTTNGNGLEKSKLYDYAQQIGVDREKFTQCLDSGQMKAEVTKDVEDGTKAGVSGTPGFIIGTMDGNKVSGKLISGAYPLESFKQIIDEQLAK